MPSELLAKDQKETTRAYPEKPDEDRVVGALPANWQVFFHYLDLLIYNELVEPYLAQYIELLLHYSTEYAGLEGVSWASKPWRKPTADELDGNLLACLYSWFDRRFPRYGEKLGKSGQSFRHRQRKTATNIWLTERFSGPCEEAGSYHTRHNATWLRSQFDPEYRDGNHPWVFDAELEGNGLVSSILL